MSTARTSAELVFNHIPKTAGTSLRGALVQALGLSPEQVFHGMDRSNFGSFTDFSSLTPAARAGVVLSPAEVPLTARLVTGHLTPATTRPVLPDVAHMTLLREPRSRLLSLWLFQRAHTDFMLRRWGSFGEWFACARRPLAEYLRNPDVAAQTDNATVRFLLWPDRTVSVDRFLWPDFDEANLAAAERVLDGFDHVGVVEDPQCATRIGDLLGRRLELPRTNVVRPLPADLIPDLDAELTDEALALLDARTRLDRRLWDWAAAALLLNEDLAAVRDRAWSESLDRYRVALRRPLQVPARRRLIERVFSATAPLRHRN